MTPEAESVVKTAWELAIQEGFDRGEKLGQARGEVRGVREALLRLLHARFGEISSSDRRRVEAADLTLLRCWFDRAVGAARVEDVWRD